YQEVVQVPGAPWLRLHIDRADLGRGSYITITSLQDNAVQRLDAASLAQWQNWSAYFNGPAVVLKLYAAGGDRPGLGPADRRTVGEAGPESQCGLVDDRVASSNPRVGRLLNVGCTAWLVPGGWLLTAGHCLESAGSINVLEFNVPPSLPGGTIQHPGPNDQYA